MSLQHEELLRVAMLGRLRTTDLAEMTGDALLSLARKSFWQESVLYS